MANLTPDDLTAIEQRAAAIRPGNYADTKPIEFAAECIPTLCQAIRQAWAENERLREDLKDIHDLVPELLGDDELERLLTIECLEEILNPAQPGKIMSLEESIARAALAGQEEKSDEQE